MASNTSQIQFNVGGRLFATSKLTFAQYHECFFARMLDGDWSESITSGQPIFIDRDPDSFGIILNWLRYNGQIILPTDRSLRELLCGDADFYQLSGLREALGPVTCGIKYIYFIVSCYHHKTEAVSIEAIQRNCGPDSLFLRNILIGDKGFTEKEPYRLKANYSESVSMFLCLLRLGFVPETAFGKEYLTTRDIIEDTTSLLIEYELAGLARELEKLNRQIPELIEKN